MSLSTRVDALAARIAVAVKALRDDPRWTDARTPTAHAARHTTTGDDPVTPAAIGAAADSAVVHNTGTETIGGAKTFSIAPQVPVGSLLAHPVRRDDARLTDARTPTTHDHDAAAITTGRLAGARMPLVLSNTLTGSGSGGVGTNAVNGNLLSYTATGNITIGPPTNPADRQVIRYEILASGGARTVSIDAAIRTSTGLTRGPHSVPSGQVLLCALEYSGLAAAWVLIALTISAT